MTTRADFDAEQWARIAEAPVLAAMRVMTAARGGTVREGIALAREYTERRREGGEGLLAEILRTAPSLDPATVGGPDALRDRSDRLLREALAALDARARPDEREAYRSFVRDLAATVAAAHREGGVLGIGGTEVSAPERAVLDELEAVLGPEGGGSAPGG
ncbi:MAG TPA: hypothetical protein VNT51_10460 [Miltoncostaeaceae bacterium]|nr:hypothetical protein [Miltoncostaeaceae bacterium]